LKCLRPEGVVKTTVAANISDPSLYVEESKKNADGEPVDSNGKRMYKKAEYGQKGKKLVNMFEQNMQAE
jgi:hypothetical protein